VRAHRASPAAPCGGGATATIATALRLSCNIPFAQLGLQLGYPAISQEARKFGFGDENLRVPMPVEPSVYPPIASDELKSMRP